MNRADVGREVTTRSIQAPCNVNAVSRCGGLRRQIRRADGAVYVYGCTAIQSQGEGTGDAAFDVDDGGVQFCVGRDNDSVRVVEVNRAGADVAAQNRIAGDAQDIQYTAGSDN